MVSTIAANPKELFTQHMWDLRSLARKVMVRGEVMTEAEDADKTRRMQEMVAIGTTFGLTENELVKAVFSGLLSIKRGCGCPTCRERMPA